MKVNDESYTCFNSVSVEIRPCPWQGLWWQFPHNASSEFNLYHFFCRRSETLNENAKQMINQQLTCLRGAYRVRATRMFHSQNHGIFLKKSFLLSFPSPPCCNFHQCEWFRGRWKPLSVQRVWGAVSVNWNSNAERNSIARGDFTARMNT
jgi:hypothetical protein